jgi:hypothetical protein
MIQKENLVGKNVKNKIIKVGHRRKEGRKEGSKDEGTRKGTILTSATPKIKAAGSSQTLVTTRIHGVTSKKKPDN